MTIRFLKDEGAYKKGEILPDCFRNSALELIAAGIAEEVGAAPISLKDLQLPTPKPTPKAEKEA